MANPWNTLHIFGFGTVQAISDTQNVQAPYSAVKDLADLVVDSVWNKRPEGYTGNKTYHAINNLHALLIPIRAYCSIDALQQALRR